MPPPAVMARQSAARPLNQPAGYPREQRAGECGIPLPHGPRPRARIAASDGSRLGRCALRVHRRVGWATPDDDPAEDCREHQRLGLLSDASLLPSDHRLFQETAGREVAVGHPELCAGQHARVITGSVRYRSRFVVVRFCQRARWAAMSGCRDRTLDPAWQRRAVASELNAPKAGQCSSGADDRAGSGLVWNRWPGLRAYG